MKGFAEPTFENNQCSGHAPFFLQHVRGPCDGRTLAGESPVLCAPGTAGWPRVRRTTQTHSETGCLPAERPSK